MQVWVADVDSVFSISDEHIDLKIGRLYFTKVKDKDRLYDYASQLILDKRTLLEYLKSIGEEHSEVLYESLNQIPFFDFLIKIRDLEITFYDLYDLYLSFKSLFLFCFKEDVFDKIQTSKEFEYYRDLIIEVNCINIDKPNLNPEIERFNKIKKMMNKGESVSFETMYTSVWVCTQTKPNEMTLYQFNKLFFRISQMKAFDMTTLYKTVDSKGSIKIESWAKNEEKETEKSVSLLELMNSGKKF